MLVKERKILEYRNPKGNNVFRQWLFSIADKKSREIIDSRILRLKTGNLGDFKNLGSGIYELRIDFGGGFRLYFGQIDSETLILLSGGRKKSQSSDILKSYELWEGFKKTGGK
jgi:putative addiction module killer protein